MADPGPGEGEFRVTDRRRRAADEEPAPPPPSPLSPPPSAPPSAPHPGRGEAERSLAGLFMMLAGSATVALGAAPDPRGGQSQPDLGQAGELIDVLVLLRERTEGNRTAEETEVLEQLIYDLHLQYVAARKRSG